LDRIRKEIVLASAAGLAKAGGLRTDRKVAWRKGPAVRVEPGKGDLVIRPARGDLRPFDQFSVPVHAGAGVRGSVGMEVRLSSHTEGIQHPDRFFINCRTRIDWTGWRNVEFPYENFLIYGIPEGWSPVKEVVVSVRANRPVHVGGLLLQHRSRVVGPRMTDEGLFEELDLSYPGMERVARAVKQGDLKRAKQAMLDHLRTRARPRHIYGKRAEVGKDYSTAAADRVCDHYINGQQLGREIDWRANPIGYLEWMHAFNRHSFMGPLVTAYKVTKDEKYAKELDYLMSTWMAMNPAPVDNNGGGDPAWETLSTACRIYTVWMEMFFALLDAPGFRDETRIAMLKSFWDHAEHLMDFQGGANNWLIVESRVIAMIGTVFPEFKRAAAWREEGYRRLTNEIRRQVYPDGAQYEIAAGYHAMSAGGFAEAYELAKLNGIPLEPVYARRLEGTYDYIMHITRPDWTRPSFNDSGSFQGRGGGFLLEGARLFRREDLRWVGTEGREGRPPRRTSHAFPDSGIYVMRSGWGRDDRWLMADFGPYGGAHQHEDKLSFEVYACGTPFIVDPGIVSYMLEDWTTYHRNPEAHNTIMIDGCGQHRGRREMHEDHVRSARGTNVWASGRGLDFLSGSYASGYRGLVRTFVHRRAILFVKPDYWVVWDEVSGRGAHEVESLFHFTPMRIQADEANGVVRTNRLGRANLDMILSPHDGVGVSIVCGQERPVQGWIAVGGENIPSPAVVLKKKGRLPIRLATILCPYVTGVNAGVTVETLRAGRAAWAARLRHRDGRCDEVFLRWNEAGMGRFGGLRTDADVALVRRDARGKVVYAGIVNGTTLMQRGRSLIRERRRVTLGEK